MQSRKLVLQQKLVLQRKLVLQQKLVPRQIVLSNPHLQMYPISMTILVVIGFFIPWLFKMVLATNIYTINMHELWNFLHENCTFLIPVDIFKFCNRDDMHYQGNVVELMRDDFLFCFCQYLEVERTGKWHKACSATYCKKMLFWCSEACVNSPWNLWLMDHQIQSMISDHKYFLYSNSEST